MATTRTRLKQPRKHQKSVHKGKPPKGYDSWFEYELATGPLKKASFHPPGGVPYVSTRTYYPDFHKVILGRDVYFEAKGRFRDRNEARKYIDIRAGLNETEMLVMVFQNPKTPMPGARKRSDGTRQTMAEWATKNELLFFAANEIPAEWRR